MSDQWVEHLFARACNIETRINNLEKQMREYLDKQSEGLKIEDIPEEGYEPHYTDIDAGGTVTPSCSSVRDLGSMQFGSIYKSNLQLANEKLAEQASIIAELREEKKGLIETLKFYAGLTDRSPFAESICVSAHGASYGMHAIGTKARECLQKYAEDI